MNNVTVLLPVYEEEAALPAVIDEIRGVLPECAIVAAYTPGRDASQDVLRWKKVEWVTTIEKGKGNAVRRTLPFIKTEYIVVMDADCTYPAIHILDLLAGLDDVAMGYRHQKDKGAMSQTHSFGNYCLSRLASVLYGKKVHDVCTGMWAFRREVLAKFMLNSTGFTLEADLFVNCMRRGYKIKQVPIQYRCRVDQTKPKVRISDGLKIGLFLIRMRCSRRVVTSQLKGMV